MLSPFYCKDLFYRNAFAEEDASKNMRSVFHLKIVITDNMLSKTDIEREADDATTAAATAAA